MKQREDFVRPRTAFCLLPIAFGLGALGGRAVERTKLSCGAQANLLPSAYCLLLAACCLLPAAFCSEEWCQ